MMLLVSAILTILAGLSLLLGDPAYVGGALCIVAGLLAMADGARLRRRHR